MTKVDHEAKGRKYLLIFAPIVGVIACLMSLLINQSIIWGAIASVLFAIYWTIEPGGAAGYTGAIYGQKSLGKI
ncbi:hypothetical protein [Natranaerobius trueperi]|uniref:hypothetical protein n=1 Tax=Natranaerobius trueperi TaxID=759412 RepID=UPI00197C6C42|nr:hypothetical protein [Natranaerobius trueperi]